MVPINNTHQIQYSHPHLKVFKIISTHQDLLQSQQCRICLQSQPNPISQLISPCNCSGSIQYIHIHCLKQWIIKSLQKSQSQNTPIQCELCKQTITYTKSIKRKCAGMKVTKQRISNNCNIFAFIMLLFLVNCAIVVYLCAMISQITKPKGADQRLVEFGVIIFTILLLFCVCVVVLVIFIKDFMFQEVYFIDQIKNVVKNRRKSSELPIMNSQFFNTRVCPVDQTQIQAIQTTQEEY